MYYSSSCQVLYVRREVAICALEGSAADSASMQTHTHTSSSKGDEGLRGLAFLTGCLQHPSSCQQVWAHLTILRVLCSARVGTLGWGWGPEAGLVLTCTQTRIQAPRSSQALGQNRNWK